MNRPGEKIDKNRYLIKSDIARMMDIPLWRLNQIINSLGGFPAEIFVTDPFTHGEIRVYEKTAAEAWIKNWRNRDAKNKTAVIDSSLARAFITRKTITGRL